MNSNYYYIKVVDKYYQILIINDKKLADRLKDEYRLNKGFCKADATIKITKKKASYFFEYSDREKNTEVIKFPNHLFAKINCFDYLDHHFMVLLGIENLKARTLLLHGSAYIKDSKGSLFLGPSGIGKSTVIQGVPRKKLYAEDTVVIKKIENDFYLFPSPFDKKHVTQVDGRPALVKQIYILVKSDQNNIVQLSLKEQLTAVMNNCIYIQSQPVIKIDKRQLSCLVLNLMESAEIVKLYFTKNFRAYRDFSRINEE